MQQSARIYRKATLIDQAVDTPVNMDITIRLATTEDSKEIMYTMQDAFQEYVETAGEQSVYTIEETNGLIFQDILDKIVFVAERDGEIVGSVRIEVNDDNTAYLSRFGVKQIYQGQGIGHAIMGQVDNMLRSRGISKLYLHTATKMTSTVRFYYGLGFYVVEVSHDSGYPKGLFVKDYIEE